MEKNESIVDAVISPALFLCDNSLFHKSQQILKVTHLTQKEVQGFDHSTPCKIFKSLTSHLMPVRISNWEHSIMLGEKWNSKLHSIIADDHGYKQMSFSTHCLHHNFLSCVGKPKMNCAEH